MNTRSLSFRLTAWHAGLLVVLGLAFGAYSYWRLDHYLSLYWTELLSHRAERIATALLTNIKRTGDHYVRSEIEARYAPESNDRFVRVTRDHGSDVFISGDPNDHSFSPLEV